MKKIEPSLKDWCEWFNKCERAMTFMSLHGLMRLSDRRRIQENIKKKYDKLIEEQVVGHEAEKKGAI